MTNNKLTDEEITELALKLFDGSSFYFQSGRRPGAKTMAELLNKAACAVAELQERRKADGAEPIYQLFDADWYDTNKGTYDDVTSAGMKGRIVYAVPQPLTDAERAELQERGKAGDIRDLFLRAKHLMYQSGGSPIENSLNPIDAWLYDAEHAATQSTPLAKGGDNAQ